ncbi:hypothetical protein DC74_892 [Streptomyces noursei]|nr:hypothetical protein DC74_892 [Streptomyces noursei]
MVINAEERGQHMPLREPADGDANGPALPRLHVRPAAHGAPAADALTSEQRFARLGGDGAGPLEGLHWRAAAPAVPITRDAPSLGPWSVSCI